MSVEIDDTQGYGRSDKRTYLFTNGHTTEAIVDFGRPYSFYVIRCEDCANIPDNTLLSLKVAVELGQTVIDLYEINDPSTIWSKGVPTTGTCQFMINHAFGSQILKLTLSNAVVGNVTFMIYGFDPVIRRS
jgi:hypothetical protein